jgi:1-aminocyclopropane-1-carboxylate deaminase/D-cysteine desulfhydrase-like pyridoxal-dependent ACC family enzyme
MGDGVEKRHGYSITGQVENRVRQIKLPESQVPLQRLHDPLLQSRGVAVSVLRLDLIHPWISGNKWFKLRLSLEQARLEGRHTLLSFGGAWSNHLLALAAAGREFGFGTIGMVRGEVPRPLNPLLQTAEDFGMTLVPVDRASYRNKLSAEFLRDVYAEWGDIHVIPEGGASIQGVLGSMAIADSVQWSERLASVRIVTLATATGTTLAGVVAGLGADVRVDATLVLKGEDGVSAQVRDWLAQLPRRPHAAWQVLQGWHCGGYARSAPELVQFMRQFTETTGVPLEPVYSGKMMWSLYARIASGEIPEGAEIVAIHTGGILPHGN